MTAEMANCICAILSISCRAPICAAITAGALHEHLGGGFFRTCHDPGWREPAGEKRARDAFLLALVLIFLILAAVCFARSSQRLEAWIENHPKFGPPVVAWRRHGAIPRKAKYLSIGMMTISFVVVAIAHPPALWFWLTGAVLLACALFVATRPEGPKAAS